MVRLSTEANLYTSNKGLHPSRLLSDAGFFSVLVGDGGGERACEGVAQVRGDHFEGQRSILHLLVRH